MSPKSRPSTPTKKPAKAPSTTRGTKRVSKAAGAPRSERPKEPKVTSNRPGAVRFPGAEEELDRRSREEHDYRDEVMQTRERR